jgi:hypothetical protein
MAAAKISAISGSSAILTYAYDYDGIRKDALGKNIYFIYIHIYLYTYIYVFIYIYKYIHIYSYIFVYIYIIFVGHLHPFMPYLLSLYVSVK